MKTYNIEIIEILSRVITIKAESEYEATRKARYLYKGERIVLDDTDYVDVDFKLLLDNHEMLEK
ncbi:MAG: DpnD/PcfM family protein [Streptococcaceae bacterium]|jgi:hypothetical protein|nr:DpnD/PcfM family protein [Streptococcaceae bacterium]